MSTSSAGGGMGESMPQVSFLDADGNVAEEARYGELFSVRVDGLLPGEEATLRSRLWGYRGWASYAADADGVIDTRTSPAVAGTYAGVHAEGLLWSMQLEDNSTENNFDVHVAVEVDGVERHAATFRRHGLNQGLVTESFEVDGAVGRIFSPVDADALPGVLVLGGSEGGSGSAEFMAAWLAGYGYTTLALAYFAAPGLPADLEEVDLSYFAGALDSFAARPDVDGTRLAVMGGSRGSEAALMIGARYGVRAVIATAASGLRWSSVYDPDVAAWSEDGVPLPYMPTSPAAMPEVVTLEDGTTAYRTTPQFVTSIADADPAALEAATISAELSDGAVLLLGGADDGVWPACQMAQITLDRLTASGHASTHADALHCFPAAGHVGITPGWPTADTGVVHLGSYAFITGGTPEGNHDAMRAGLDAVRAFLASELSP